MLHRILSLSAEGASIVPETEDEERIASDAHKELGNDCRYGARRKWTEAEEHILSDAHKERVNSAGKMFLSNRNLKIASR
jgi:hypothetical protein